MTYGIYPKNNGSEITEQEEVGMSKKKKICGATGKTGKRIVKQLLAKGPGRCWRQL
ncbi:hypothetical protein LguiB_033963 [Lonicera macranthoides]